MKKVFYAVFAGLLIQTALFAQTAKEVKPLLEKYTQDMVNGDWAKSLDYTYPGLYQVVPREQMEAAIATTFDDTSMFVIGFTGMEFGSISEVYTDADYDYSFVKYTMEMTMRFTSGVPEENHQSTADLMKMQFGDENVRLNGKTMYIKQNNTMAAVKDKSDNKIYFLEIKEQLWPVMEQFMSEEFIETAKGQI